MAKTRNWLARLLGKAANSVFHFLSRWEERGVMPGTIRRLKVAVLGVVASLVVSLTLNAQEPVVTCYVVARLPEVEITDISVSPNPTAGADSITVTAKTAVTDISPEGSYISGANVLIEGDTASVSIPLEAADGKFNEAKEKVQGRISVEAVEPGTTWVSIVATTSEGATEIKSIWLVVTEEDTENREESQD